MTPAEFDKQSIVQIDYWIDVESEESKDKDQDRDLTKYMIKIGFEDGWMQTDSNGRIWGYDSTRNLYHPFHFEYGKKKIGYRIAKKAAN